MTAETGWNEATEGEAANVDLWKDVEAESQLILEITGEGFTGRLIAMDEPNATGIVQIHLVNVEDLDGNSLESGNGCFMNATRDLINKLKKVPLKSFIRVQWIDNLDTGHSSGTKMRVFKVQWR